MATHPRGYSTARFLALLAVLMAGCSSAPSPSTSSPPAWVTPLPASPSPSASSTPSPTPASPPASATADGWEAVPEQDAVQGVQFQNVVWTGTRFVATGVALDAAGVFLDSTDGLTWHRQPPPGSNAYPANLAAGPRGIVAVGTVDDLTASWSSPGGLTSTARADAFRVPGIGTDTVRVTSVVDTDDGWLAVGRRDPACNLNCGTAPVRAIAWTSTDGLHWTRVPDQSSMSRAAMTGVARLGSGFVAVGLAASRAAVWTSTNGSTWTRVPAIALFRPRSGSGSMTSTEMTGVAVDHGVVVAVGMDVTPGGGDHAVRAWWSTDGRTWAEATGDRFKDGQAFSVASTPAGFLATGPSGEPSCRGGIWSSTDGRAWRCVASDPPFEGFSPYAAAGSSSFEIAVGLNSNAPDTGAGAPGAVWRRSLS
jgi:hypothetical protein